MKPTLVLKGVSLEWTIYLVAMSSILAPIGIWSYFVASVAYLRAVAGDGLADAFYETELHHMAPESLRATVLSLHEV